MTRITSLSTLLVAAGLLTVSAIALSQQSETQENTSMQLGAFSISLAVEDIGASRDFYAKLGFKEVGGDAENNWLILRNGSTTIGLFQGMFEDNIMTFNPGWDAEAQPLESFTDVRELQKSLQAQGVEVINAADENGTGPASFVVVDPDGNSILVDQHVDAPGR